MSAPEGLVGTLRDNTPAVGALGHVEHPRAVALELRDAREVGPSPEYHLVHRLGGGPRTGEAVAREELVVPLGPE